MRQDWQLSFTLKIKEYGPGEYATVLRLGDDSQNRDFFQNRFVVFIARNPSKDVHIRGATTGSVDRKYCQLRIEKNVEYNFSISRSYKGIIDGKNKWSYRILKDGVEKYSSPLETYIRQYNNIKLKAADSISSTVINLATIKNVQFEMNAVGKLYKMITLLFPLDYTFSLLAHEKKNIGNKLKKPGSCTYP